MAQNKNKKQTQQQRRQHKLDKIEAAKIEKFKAEQAAKRRQRLKTIGIAILCIALVFAFCVPTACSTFMGSSVG